MAFDAFQMCNVLKFTQNQFSTYSLSYLFTAMFYAIIDENLRRHNYLRER